MWEVLGWAVIAGAWIYCARITTIMCDRRADHWQSYADGQKWEAQKLAGYSQEGGIPKRLAETQAEHARAKRWVRLFLVMKYSAWALWPIYALCGAVWYVYDEVQTDRHAWKD